MKRTGAPVVIVTTLENYRPMTERTRTLPTDDELSPP
jgi:hypothetical protein